jgi:hypothetical protein
MGSQITGFKSGIRGRVIFDRNICKIEKKQPGIKIGSVRSSCQCGMTLQERFGVHLKYAMNELCYSNIPGYHKYPFRIWQR